MVVNNYGTASALTGSGWGRWLYLNAGSTYMKYEHSLRLIFIINHYSKECVSTDDVLHLLQVYMQYAQHSLRNYWL